MADRLYEYPSVGATTNAGEALVLFTRPPFVISIPQPGDKRLTVTTPPLSETMFSKPTKDKVVGVELFPSMDTTKGEVWPPPLGALTVTTPAFSEVVNPTKDRVEGVWLVPSRDTFRGERSQLMVFDPSILMLVPA